MAFWSKKLETNIGAVVSPLRQMVDLAKKIREAEPADKAKLTNERREFAAQLRPRTPFLGVTGQMTAPDAETVVRFTRAATKRDGIAMNVPLEPNEPRKTFHAADLPARRPRREELRNQANPRVPQLRPLMLQRLPLDVAEQLVAIREPPPLNGNQRDALVKNALARGTLDQQRAQLARVAEQLGADDERERKLQAARAETAKIIQELAAVSAKLVTTDDDDEKRRLMEYKLDLRERLEEYRIGAMKLRAGDGGDT